MQRRQQGKTGSTLTLRPQSKQNDVSTVVCASGCRCATCSDASYQPFFYRHVRYREHYPSVLALASCVSRCADQQSSRPEPTLTQGVTSGQLTMRPTMDEEDTRLCAALELDLQALKVPLSVPLFLRILDKDNRPRLSTPVLPFPNRCCPSQERAG